MAVGRAMLVGALLALAMIGTGRAESFPARAVRIIVPYPPAGANDLLARLIGDRLSAAWHQPVVIENKPGANAVVGCVAAKNSAPAGYTLLVGATGPHAINPALYGKLP